MLLPPALLNSLEGIPGFDRESFTLAHDENSITSVRINPLKKIPVSFFSPGSSTVTWATDAYYLNERPSFTFDPLFHAGCYYVQEASSMFIEQAVRQTVDVNSKLKVLDLCAAPGGKTTHLQSLLPNSLIVSNEVIRSRTPILDDNVVKWGGDNLIITSNDASRFAALPGYFDLVVVDAPCSGSGLFRKDPLAIEEWSPANVQLCSHRQKRILKDMLPCLKNEGILIYATCSYSIEEDEQICDWLVRECGMIPVKLKIDPEWNISVSQTEIGSEGYRFFPGKTDGEGFFLAVFKCESSEQKESRSKPAQNLSNSLQQYIAIWLKEERAIVEIKDDLYAIREGHLQDLGTISKELFVHNAGVRLGKIMKNRLVPEHGLALSSLLSADVTRVELDLDKAILYLQKKDFLLDTSEKGWQVVTYKGFSLGWINVLQNRFNNYYPKESRILKDTSG